MVYHFHTRTKTARSGELNERGPHPYIEIHPAAAARLEIELGDLVEIASPNGRWDGVAMAVNQSGLERFLFRFTTAMAPNQLTSTAGMRETRSAISHSSSPRRSQSVVSALSAPSHGYRRALPS